MTLMWSSELAVGVPEIDEHHEVLVTIFNDLHTAHDCGQGHAIIGSILCRLSDYASHHFAREEHYLRVLKCPDYEAHRAEHDRLMHHLSMLVHGYEMGSKRVADDTLAFLRTWLLTHILEGDRASLTVPAARLAA